MPSAPTISLSTSSPRLPQAGAQVPPPRGASSPSSVSTTASKPSRRRTSRGRARRARGKMVLTNFTGIGVGLGFRVGCGFGVGWGFGGVPPTFGFGIGGGRGKLMDSALATHLWIWQRICEYKRGISGWNFNIDDMKAQAALENDEVMLDKPVLSSPEEIAHSLSNQNLVYSERRSQGNSELENNLGENCESEINEKLPDGAPVQHAHERKASASSIPSDIVQSSSRGERHG